MLEHAPGPLPAEAEAYRQLSAKDRPTATPAAPTDGEPVHLRPRFHRNGALWRRFRVSFGKLRLKAVETRPRAVSGRKWGILTPLDQATAYHRAGHYCPRRVPRFLVCGNARRHQRRGASVRNQPQMPRISSMPPPHRPPTTASRRHSNANQPTLPNEAAFLCPSPQRKPASPSSPATTQVSP